MNNKRFRRWRCVFANMLYRRADEPLNQTVNSDIDRYLSLNGVSQSGRKKIALLDELLLSEETTTFRNVFYYRFQGKKRLCLLSGLVFPSVKEIEIYGSIGAGLFLHHHYMVLHPQRAGRNLRVDAGAVIGTNKGQFPIIGDNVTIGANATVIGGISIGDNVVIEPGSVVTKDLESNAVYGGNPAVFKRKINESPGPDQSE